MPHKIQHIFPKTSVQSVLGNSHNHNLRLDCGCVFFFFLPWHRKLFFYNVTLLEKLCKKVLYSMAKLFFNQKLFHFFCHRDSFRKYLFFFSRSNIFIIFQEGPFVSRTDMNFPGRSICSSNRHEFSRRVCVLRTDTNFPGGLIENTCFFKEVLSVRRTELINSSNRY